ncbi:MULTISPECIES: hypothetical protein [unclassified Acidovorax]|uniref:hypothetical protein n=1 Tax=unclassified Acidovorax TaxID=2684926 RepID=UPI0023DE341E|nr:MULTISPECIES: hypothetical protein [unclassified Acidovorax]GKS87442.1 hypothetical protein AVMA1855_24840 [Acidovorax sp. SUPP1855]GKS97456.1 hypothetical protein AVAK2825_22995 [Acidovorax sp. SUPP2825]
MEKKVTDEIIDSAVQGVAGSAGTILSSLLWFAQKLSFIGALVSAAGFACAVLMGAEQLFTWFYWLIGCAITALALGILTRHR